MSTATRCLTLTVEAASHEALQKLLEQALFELETLKRGTWTHTAGHVAPGHCSGTLGEYRLEYGVGSRELCSLRTALLEEGYTSSNAHLLIDFAEFDDYEHPSKPTKRLHFSPPHIEELTEA